MNLLGGMKRSGDVGKGWYGRWRLSISLWPGQDPWFWYDNGGGPIYPAQKRLRLGIFFFAFQCRSKPWMKTDKYFPVAGISPDERESRNIK